ncbi:Na(+)-translocating NADH-quinone reductase subunit F [Roseburia inulinivorans]|uniref:Na(+)-translocating NADH-quinone reductase subunit F n=2 Tax=Roseburia inulinivorans TaxID=360807 RepID=A0A173RCR0_9FIRM|nr:Na(+)-translocating NADH-quinone reductase subunit F [Roseburia inulinivorans]
MLICCFFKVKEKMIIDRSKQQKNLLEMLQEKNEYISAPCNGNGICGKCIVRYKSGATEPTKQDREFLSEKQLEQGYRLACQSYPTEEYKVEIPELEETIEVLSQWENQRTEEILKNTAEGTAEKTENALYGICIDIGTTTLAALLVNLETEADCQTAVSVNHQRTYGSDVLSRISASNGGKKWEIQRCIRQDLQKLIRELLQKEKITEQQIQRIVIAGNTTMCHLLRGFSCETLGVAPFLPVDLSWMEGSAADFLGMKELDTKVVILPGISAFVGADIMAGIAKMNMHRSEGYHLLLDIGTNGEMVLGNCRHMYVTSTSAGPAFEGGNISCGMASIPGVISHVFMEETGKAGFQVIGETDGENKKQQAIGICGTGMIDLVYELREHQMIDEHGTYSDLYFDTGYELAEKVKFTQNDIRELQMAKAAIRAGVDILVKKAGITFDEVDDCYLAGGFGTKIDIKKAAGIGLIPKELEMKTIPAGNTVLAGTKEVLLGKISKEELEKIQTMADVINLAEENDFEEMYLSYMDF